MPRHGRLRPVSSAVRRYGRASIPAVATSKDVVFISHANPEDNEFTHWLSLKLASLGYHVWSDVTRLHGGEDFWRDIHWHLRQRSNPRSGDHYANNCSCGGNRDVSRSSCADRTKTKRSPATFK